MSCLRLWFTCMNRKATGSEPTLVIDRNWTKLSVFLWLHEFCMVRNSGKMTISFFNSSTCIQYVNLLAKEGFINVIQQEDTTLTVKSVGDIYTYFWVLQFAIASIPMRNGQIGQNGQTYGTCIQLLMTISQTCFNSLSYDLFHFFK